MRSFPGPPLRWLPPGALPSGSLSKRSECRSLPAPPERPSRRGPLGSRLLPHAPEMWSSPSRLAEGRFRRGHKSGRRRRGRLLRRRSGSRGWRQAPHVDGRCGRLEGPSVPRTTRGSRTRRRAAPLGGGLTGRPQRLAGLDHGQTARTVARSSTPQVPHPRSREVAYERWRNIKSGKRLSAPVENWGLAEGTGLRA